MLVKHLQQTGKNLVIKCKGKLDLYKKFNFFINDTTFLFINDIFTIMCTLVLLMIFNCKFELLGYSDAIKYCICEAALHDTENTLHLNEKTYHNLTFLDYERLKEVIT
jgi:hypothetical protein